MMKPNSWLSLGNTNIYSKDSREEQVSHTVQEEEKTTIKKTTSVAPAGPRKHLIFLNPK